jgi:hypothetical protein
MFIVCRLHLIYAAFGLISRTAPVDEAISYERRVFNQGLWGERTNYMGFSPEADEAWESLLEGLYIAPAL